jgi:hypothetical protein
MAVRGISPMHLAPVLGGVLVTALAVPNALAVEPSAAGRETSRVLAHALGRPGTAAVS